MQLSKIEKHFKHRAKLYESSAAWVKDKGILTIIEDLAGAGSDDFVLDVATGTGLIAELFFRKAKVVVGLDFTQEMFKQALLRLNFMVNAQAENLPFSDNVFDLVTCRQGLQFMDAFKAVSQMHRVCKPGGKIILVQLAALGNEDKEYAFKIQMSRQPVRENCFVEDDLVHLLKKSGCKKIQSCSYFSEESINEWINNGALSKARQERIKRLYYDAPLSYKKTHDLKFVGNDIIDKMKISIVCGYKE